MKKLLTMIALVSLSASTLMAGNSYKLNDKAVDALFSQAKNVSHTMMADVATPGNLGVLDTKGIVQNGEKTVGGFLLRAYFCGSFALHRSYMGTGDKKTMLFRYLCIPVVGGFTACMDFWYVLFKGEEALNKYKDNGKFMVWAGN